MPNKGAASSHTFCWYLEPLRQAASTALQPNCTFKAPVCKLMHSTEIKIKGTQRCNIHSDARVCCANPASTTHVRESMCKDAPTTKASGTTNARARRLPREMSAQQHPHTEIHRARATDHHGSWCCAVHSGCQVRFTIPLQTTLSKEKCTSAIVSCHPWKAPIP